MPIDSTAAMFCASFQVMGTGPSDAVEFLPIDFSIPPEEHDDKHGRGMDVILHKLSDDIMIRCVPGSL